MLAATYPALMFVDPEIRLNNSHVLHAAFAQTNHCAAPVLAHTNPSQHMDCKAMDCQSMDFQATREASEQAHIV
jgi:uncharacterized protein YcbK (DUF882 family)